MSAEAYPSKRWQGPIGYTIGNVKVWVVLALVFIGLQIFDWARRGFAAEGSPLGFLDALRTVTFLVGVILNEHFHLRDRIMLSRRLSGTETLRLCETEVGVFS